MNEWQELERALYKLICDLYGGVNDPVEQGEAEAYINQVYMEVVLKAQEERGGE